MGKKVFKQTLRTRDVVEAQRLALRISHRYAEIIKHLRGLGVSKSGEGKPLVGAAISVALDGENYTLVMKPDGTVELKAEPGPDHDGAMDGPGRMLAVPPPARSRLPAREASPTVSGRLCLGKPMRSTDALLSLLLPALLLVSTPAMSSEKDDAQQILQADREICAAFEREDANWLEQHLDPTFTLTSSTGKVTTRADEVADLRGGTKYDVFRNRDSKVRLYGDAAVVTGITRVEGKNEGKSYALDFQFTDTYVRKPGGWVLVASHASRLPGAK